MADLDAIRLLHAAWSPAEPAGTPPYPKDPEYQPRGLMAYFIYWAARHELESRTRVDASRCMLALGRFTRAVLLGARYPLFAQATMRLEGFQALLQGAVGEGQQIALGFLTYVNWDTILEEKKGDPAVIAAIQRRSATLAGGLS